MPRDGPKHPGWAHHSGATHVSNGPFKLDLWKLSDELQLTQNPLYWDAPTVKFEKIEISIIEDEMQAFDRFEDQSLDWLGDPLSKIPPQKANELRKNQQLHIDQQSYGLFWMQMNMQKMPFQNADIRKAFAYGANRSKLITDVLLSEEDIPAFGFSLTPMQAQQPQFSDGDSERALACFEKGLHALGITRKGLSPLVITHSNIAEQALVTEVLAEQWSLLFDIKITCKEMKWNTYFKALAQNDVSMGGLAWYPRYSDPTYFYELFISRNYAVQVTSWKDKQYESLIYEARMTDNQERKKMLLAQAENILLEAMPAIPLFYQYSRYIKNPLLEGYITTQANQIDFRTAYKG